MKGQTLIEVLIALAVAVLIISAISIAVVSSLNNAIFSKNQNLATQYAQEGMEVMRRVKTTKWSEFNAYTSGDYCLDNGSTSLRVREGNNCGQNIDIFMREVYLEDTSSECQNAYTSTKLKVSVYWSDGKCKDAINPFCNKAEVVSCFNDANVIQSP